MYASTTPGVAVVWKTRETRGTVYFLHRRFHVDIKKGLPSKLTKYFRTLTAIWVTTANSVYIVYGGGDSKKKGANVYYTRAHACVYNAPLYEMCIHVYTYYMYVREMIVELECGSREI